jgi:tape measure domain-containing protein
MATVKNTIRLQDKMTPVLRSIIKAMNSTMTAMAGVDRVGNTAFQRMQRDIRNAEAALNQFNSEASEIPTQANKGAAAFTKMKNPLVTAAALIYTIKNALAAVGNVTGIVDEFTLTTARLNLMNDGLQTTSELQDAIFESAKRSRAEYAATASSVAKMGLLAGDAFKNTKEIVAFSELMNKSFKIGGASIQEQTAGMYQLTQAMAAGKLQGDEFRSIMENAPLLADAIAKYTGKTKGELKKMSAEGTITADIIKGAMFAAATDINDKFSSLPMTFGDAMVNIKNEGLQAFQPVIEKLNKLVNSEGFKQFSADVVAAMQKAAQWVSQFIDDMQRAVGWVQQNWPLVQSIVVGALTGIAVAYAGARVAALLYAFAQGAVNIELLILNARLLAVGALIAGAVILWNNWGVAGKILAIILGVLAGVILVATVAQWAFNASLWACPLVWIIALVIAVIAIIVVLVLWILDLWKTNMDFKYGILGIWNAILNFFDQVPIFFMGVGYGIADAFSYAKVTVLNILQAMANGVIDIINGVIDTLNLIPGVSIEKLNHMTFATEAALDEEAKRQARADDYQAAKDAAAAKAAEREAELAANRAEDEANLAAQKAKAEADKAKAEESNNPANAEPDWQALAASAGNPTLNGGTLDKVKGDVSITDEDIKLLKDVAATEFINRYTTLRPELTVTFGDVRETADVGQIMTVIEDMVEEAYAASLVNG